MFVCFGPCFVKVERLERRSLAEKEIVERKATAPARTRGRRCRLDQKLDFIFLLEWDADFESHLHRVVRITSASFDRFRHDFVSGCFQTPLEGLNIVSISTEAVGLNRSACSPSTRRAVEAANQQAIRSAHEFTNSIHFRECLLILNEIQWISIGLQLFFQLDGSPGCCCSKSMA